MSKSKIWRGWIIVNTKGRIVVDRFGCPFPYGRKRDARMDCEEDDRVVRGELRVLARERRTQKA